ncbi:hypothetical protein PR048_018822 [Dryococelus australis]|uniref:Uncharacterized protein n=1 Tax=Dryococelus australis TaxID=614101 RepID=A0ABQ9H1V2_9NEOP|nr:hypothetical protein PR048_018822 [Dryococelus australis]
MKCQERIMHEQREKIFTEYLIIGTSAGRAAYLGSSMEIQNPAKHGQRKREEQRYGRCTVEYHATVNGENVPVCKACLKNILCETNKFMENTLGKKISSCSGLDGKDMRGSRVPHHKLSEERLEKAKTHLLSLPAYERY